MKRVVIAGIAGGFVMFIWGFVSHVLLPIGEIGLDKLPNEETTLAAMRNQIDEPGLYFFPGLDHGAKPTPEEEAAWAKIRPTYQRELMIGAAGKGHERRIHGHRHAGVRIVQEGPTLVLALDAHLHHPEPFTETELSPYRTATAPISEQQAIARRKIMRKARSSKKRSLLLEDFETRYANLS